jgi:serine protease SohB
MHTAGSRKALLDPFQPEDPDDVARLKHLQRGIHDNFIAHVRQARGARLTGAPETLFSGDIWLAGEAQALGLIDGIGHLVPMLKQRFGEDVRFNVATPRRTLLQRLGAPGIGQAAAAGAEAVAEGGMAALERRAAWARYGL